MKAGRLPLRLLTGVSVASIAGLLVTVIWLSDPDPRPADPGPSDLVRVGVIEGQSIPGYVDSTHGELRALTGNPSAGDTWALVTLRSYLPPDRLTPLLSGVAVAQVYARAPLPGMFTEVVRIPAFRIPDDVVAGMLATAAGRDQERADYRQLGNSLHGQDDNDVRLRRAYESAARVAGDEASAYRAHCACVFAAVVRAAPAALAGVATRAGVRAVDPAPEVRDPDRTEFRPPLPEQRTTAPPDPATVAPPTPAPIPSSPGAGVTSASSGGPVAPSGASPSASEAHADASPGPAVSRGSGAPRITSSASGS